MAGVSGSVYEVAAVRGVCSNLTLAGGEWRAGGRGPAPLLDLDSAVCPLLAADRPQSSPGFREASVTIPR